MKRYFNKPILLSCLVILAFTKGNAQTVDAAYVKKLYQQYPTEPSDFCDACKYWENPFFKSIADTERHMPLITYYVYTKAHRLEQEQNGPERKGVYSAWHSAYGQPNETPVYSQANKESPDMIAKGHCQAWILLGWCGDGAILSDTYTFNAGMEYQGQNVGTEIATEELCRTLTGFKAEDGEETTDSVKIWCGTFGSLHTYTAKNITVTVPTHYYKVIQYRDRHTHKVVTNCYWMPNDPSESKAQLPKRVVDRKTLTTNLGFDPMKVLHD
jgi:DNA/RNA non-specific endonuclease